jgi:hypothetical protein
VPSGGQRFMRKQPAADLEHVEDEEDGRVPRRDLWTETPRRLIPSRQTRHEPYF